MSRRRPNKYGPPPTAPIVLPDLAPPIFQQQMKARIDRLLDVLHQIDPPSGAARYVVKYNAKIDPKAFLIRSPQGAFRAVHDDELPPHGMGTLTDWQTCAKKIKSWLDDEAHAVMEHQESSPVYNDLQRAVGRS